MCDYHEVFAGEKVTSADMLAVREERIDIQKELLGATDEYSLVFATMSIPGPIKNSEVLEDVFLDLIEAVEQVVVEQDTLANLYRNGKTGPEYYLLTSLKAEEVKAAMIEIEEHHPLGRLANLDVVCMRKNNLVDITRTDLDLAKRSCLICKRSAKTCARGRSHSISKMYEKIAEMIQVNGKVLVE